MRIAMVILVFIVALMPDFASNAFGQDAPPAKVSNAPEIPKQDTLPAVAPGVPPPVTQEVPPTNRITGLQTNREMIAAEAATEIVISGTSVAHCGLVVNFGDGTRSGNVVSESSPFPLRLTHTYPKTDDVMLRVTGADQGSAPPCEGAVEASIHISPAGSKIEYITLSTGCPEGWLLTGAINADKSFMCTPIPDASAPTNLIHCIDGMKYFASNGHVGCRHPQLAVPEVEKYARAKTPPVKGKAQGKAGQSMGMARATTPPMAGAQGKAQSGTAAESNPRSTTPAVPRKAQARPAIKAPVTAGTQPRIKSAEAPN